MKERVVSLRRQGKTYREIQKILEITLPKSTLSYWCKNIQLNTAQQNRITALSERNLKHARKKALIVNQKKRIHYLHGLEQRNAHLSKILINKNIAKVLLAMLYLGEGAKWKSHRSLQLGSSDPEIIKLYLNLLEICYSVSRKRLTAMIYYRVDQNYKNLVRFWSKITGISILKFYKSKPDKRTKGKKTWKNYHGVCAIFGPNTEIQLELEIIAKIFFKTYTKLQNTGL